MTDRDHLVHIAAPPSQHSDIAEGLETMKDLGLFEGYEFMLTEPGVGVVDVDGLADAVADRVGERLDEVSDE